MDWAKECVEKPKLSKGKITVPAVIGAIIDLGNCLNLIDTHHQEVIREAYRGICSLCEKEKTPIPVNKEKCRKLDRAVINAAVELNRSRGYPEFDSVRSPYFEGDFLYPNANFKEKTHIQICVRNMDCIKGYFVPAVFLK